MTSEQLMRLWKTCQWKCQIHTLLTNIPVHAKWFTVIDLCSAFFSVPMAKESQDLFALKNSGKQSDSLESS